MPMPIPRRHAARGLPLPQLALPWAAGSHPGSMPLRISSFLSKPSPDHTLSGICTVKAESLGILIERRIPFRRRRTVRDSGMVLRRYGWSGMRCKEARASTSHRAKLAMRGMKRMRSDSVCGNQVVSLYKLRAVGWCFQTSFR